MGAPRATDPVRRFCSSMGTPWAPAPSGNIHLLQCEVLHGLQCGYLYWCVTCCCKIRAAPWPLSQASAPGSPPPLSSLTLVFVGFFCSLFLSPHCLCSILLFLRYICTQAPISLGNGLSCVLQWLDCVAGHSSHKSHPHRPPPPLPKVCHLHLTHCYTMVCYSSSSEIFLKFIFEICLLWKYLWKGFDLNKTSTYNK